MNSTQISIITKIDSINIQTTRKMFHHIMNRNGQNFTLEKPIIIWKRKVINQTIKILDPSKKHSSKPTLRIYLLILTKGNRFRKKEKLSLMHRKNMTYIKVSSQVKQEQTMKEENIIIDRQHAYLSVLNGCLILKSALSKMPRILKHRLPWWILKLPRTLWR